MNRNKNDDFYVKSVTALFEEIRLARLNPNPDDEVWSHNIIRHLNNRNLTETEKRTLQQLLTVDDNALKTDFNFEATLPMVGVNNNSTDKEISNYWFHNWWAFMLTVAAAVSIGMLIAAYIISIILENRFNSAFN